MCASECTTPRTAARGAALDSGNTHLYRRDIPRVPFHPAAVHGGIGSTPGGDGRRLRRREAIEGHKDEQPTNEVAHLRGLEWQRLSDSTRRSASLPRAWPGHRTACGPVRRRETAQFPRRRAQQGAATLAALRPRLMARCSRCKSEASCSFDSAMAAADRHAGGRRCAAGALSIRHATGRIRGARP